MIKMTQTISELINNTYLSFIDRSNSKSINLTLLPRDKLLNELNDLNSYIVQCKNEKVHSTRLLNLLQRQRNIMKLYLYSLRNDLNELPTSNTLRVERKTSYYTKLLVYTDKIAYKLKKCKKFMEKTIIPNVCYIVKAIKNHIKKIKLEMKK